MLYNRILPVPEFLLDGDEEFLKTDEMNKLKKDLDQDLEQAAIVNTESLTSIENVNDDLLFKKTMGEDYGYGTLIHRDYLSDTDSDIDQTRSDISSYTHSEATLTTEQITTH